jgi:hypothetical protein
MIACGMAVTDPAEFLLVLAESDLSLLQVVDIGVCTVSFRQSCLRLPESGFS